MGNYSERRGCRTLAKELQLAVGVPGMVLHGVAGGGGRCDERIWGRARHIDLDDSSVMLALRVKREDLELWHRGL